MEPQAIIARKNIRESSSVQWGALGKSILETTCNITTPINELKSIPEKTVDTFENMLCFGFIASNPRHIDFKRHIIKETCETSSNRFLENDTYPIMVFFMSEHPFYIISRGHPAPRARLSIHRLARLSRPNLEAGLVCPLLKA